MSLGGGPLGGDVLGGGTGTSTTPGTPPAPTTQAKVVLVGLSVGSSLRINPDGRPSTKLFVNDWGTQVVATFFDADGKVLDLNGATVTYTFTKPDRTTFTRVATVNAAGDAVYALVAGELDMAGRWRVRGYEVTDSGAWHTNIQRFTVYT